jgi:hypothetical protein
VIAVGDSSRFGGLESKTSTSSHSAAGSLHTRTVRIVDLPELQPTYLIYPPFFFSLGIVGSGKIGL